ncbi:hypothetical protein MTR67_040572 [Solanum verrucosum]|uniref:Uncharacterized protein n=1 Tax=Solanum verrucosum TaxID=315347 RepID=A0AAF0UJH9_SOLVR|nr:hypothetical protein MTR67_040572 [Solanum verrucosum]
MPVGLQLIMMQTQVTRISIQRAVDLVEHSRVSGEPHYIPADSFILYSSFSLLGCCGVCPSINLSIVEAL